MYPTTVGTTVGATVLVVVDMPVDMPVDDIVDMAQMMLLRLIETHRFFSAERD